MCDEDIELYLKKIIEVNKTLNLTRIVSFESAQLLHIEDSLVGLPELEAAPDGPAADIGTGGGFPGVPLAFKSGREFLLVDSVQKKMRAVQEVLDEFPHYPVSTYAGRIEDLAREYPHHFSVITARALTALPSLLELASPLLVQNGVLIAYKSVDIEDEFKRAQKIEKRLGFTLTSNRSFTLSDGQTPRRILVYTKTHRSALKLPRRVGMAQHNPLA